jgi:cardiolipin synthase A/B
VLTERARAGVKVHLLIDALGSTSTPKSYFKDLLAAGGQVEWYHPLRWNTWFRSNNRTHRELMAIDGRVGFIGGAGIDDQWLISKPKHPRWRDTVLRVDGNAVLGLQSTFVENWLEASGEVLSGAENFSDDVGHDGKSPAMIVTSSPSSGGSTRARILFQTLVASAQHNLRITTPYFLPDTGLRDALVDALRRGVQVQILVPGKHNDHILTRFSSRGLYGDLLKAGAHVYEYRPTMIHAKILVVDDIWSVAGSANFDNRSFGINDEVNIAVLDPQIAEKLTTDFNNDLHESEEITLEAWKHRPIYQRVIEWVGSLLERQQ